MQGTITYLLLMALMLVGTPASAQFEDEKTQLMPLPTELSLSGMAKVVTELARPADCMAPVAITRIDGEKTAVSAKGFLIEPGFHSLNGEAMLDIENCPITDSRLQLRRAQDLEVNFEAGNTYYIGYYHKPDNPEEWRLVVWNVETNP